LRSITLGLRQIELVGPDFHRQNCQKDGFCHFGSAAFCNFSAENQCEVGTASGFQKIFFGSADQIENRFQNSTLSSLGQVDDAVTLAP